MQKIASKSNGTLAGGIFGRTLAAAVIGLFINLSLSFIFTMFSTEDVGIAIYRENDDGSVTLVEEYLYTDPDFSDDIKLEEGQMSITLYSPVPDGVRLAQNIVAQICLLVLLAAFPSRYLWAQGDHDRNEANFGHIKEDPLRGLKVGLLANIPAFLTYLLLWVGKFCPPIAQQATGLFGLFHTCFAPLCQRFMAEVVDGQTVYIPATDISIGGMLALLLPVIFLPLICHVAYTMGLHQFSISDRLFYKHKKKKRKKRG